jgi:hypothetical protein
MPYDLWHAEIAKALNNKVKSKFFNIRGGEVKLVIGDQIAGLVKKEQELKGLVLQKMVDDAQDAFKKTVQKLKILVQSYDAEAEDSQDAAEVISLAAELKAEVNQEQDALKAKLLKIPKKRWDAWKKAPKEYKDYQIEVGRNVTMAALGVVGSAAALVAAVPTGGATLALGIVGGIKSVVTAAKLAYDLYVEMETVQKSVLADLKTLESAYQKYGGAKSMLGTTVNTFLMADVVPNIPKVEKNTKLWSSKLAGIDVAGRRLTSLALKTLNKATALAKELKTPKARQASEKLTKLRGSIDKLLENASDMNGRIRPPVEQSLKAAKTVVKALQQEQPQVAAIFDKAFPAFVNIALAAGNAANGIATAKSTLETANAAVTLAADLASTVKDLVE